MSPKAARRATCWTRSQSGQRRWSYRDPRDRGLHHADRQGRNLLSGRFLWGQMAKGSPRPDRFIASCACRGAPEGGESVSIMHAAEELTTAGQADLLNMSRPYLIRLVDRAISASPRNSYRHQTRGHRHLPRAGRDSCRRASLRTMVHESIFGLYDTQRQQPAVSSLADKA